MLNYTYVRCRGRLHIMLNEDDLVTTHVVDPSDPNFYAIDQKIRNGEQLSRELIDSPAKITKQTTPLPLFPELTFDGVDFYLSSELYDSKVKLSKLMCYLIAGLIENGVDCSKFIQFLIRLTFNTNMTEVKKDSLIEFLTANNKHFYNDKDNQLGCSITDDGALILLKRVDGNLNDIHTRKIPNYIGTRIWMDREDVDDNPNSTCSYGLHACTPEYLMRSKFGGGPSNVDLLILVWPEDIISIPNDYKHSKLRVAGYSIVGTTSIAGGNDEQAYFEKTGTYLPKSSRSIKVDKNGNVLEVSTEYAGHTLVSTPKQ